MIQNNKKQWSDHKGQSVPVEYLPRYRVALEKLSDELTSQAELLERSVREAKRSMADLMLQALSYLRLEEGYTDGNQFSFYSFDMQYRFEFYKKEGYLRVFRHPGFKDAKSSDYLPVNMDFTKVPTYISPPAANEKDSPAVLIITRGEEDLPEKMIDIKCLSCNGTGEQEAERGGAEPCRQCGGNGTMEVPANLVVGT